MGIRSQLFPYTPMVGARQLVSGELPPTAITTRYTMVVATQQLTGLTNAVAGHIRSATGDTGELFAAVELMERAGWEVVSFSHDNMQVFAFLRRPAVPPAGTGAAPGAGHSAPPGTAG